VLFDLQVKSGFACEEDVKTIKSQIIGRVQQLKREREVRRMSAPANIPLSVIDSQPAVMTIASQMPLVTPNLAASANRQYSQEKDGSADGWFSRCCFHSNKMCGLCDT